MQFSGPNLLALLPAKLSVQFQGIRSPGTISNETSSLTRQERRLNLKRRHGSKKYTKMKLEIIITVMAGKAAYHPASKRHAKRARPINKMKSSCWTKAVIRAIRRERKTSPGLRANFPIKNNIKVKVCLSASWFLCSIL